MVIKNSSYICSIEIKTITIKKTNIMRAIQIENAVLDLVIEFLETSKVSSDDLKLNFKMTSEMVNDFLAEITLSEKAITRKDLVESSFYKFNDRKNEITLTSKGVNIVY